MAEHNTHTASTSFSDHVYAAYLPKLFLDRLEKALVLQKFGMKASIPAGMGTVIKWNRFDNPSANTTALTEGVSPSGSSITSATVSATASQYGDFVTASDVLQTVAVNDFLKEVGSLMGYKAALSIDTLVRNELDTNGTAAYADAAGNSSKAHVQSGTDNLSSTDLKVNVKALRAADVQPFEDGYYKWVIHPYQEYGLLAETGASSFVVLAPNIQLGADVLTKGIIGHAFGVELIRSSNIRADSTSTSVYGTLLFGKNAYGVVDVNNMGLQIKSKPFGSAGTEDPLDQRATYGYKFWFVPKVLDATRVRAVWCYGA